jgi:uncharacterized membrane protein
MNLKVKAAAIVAGIFVAGFAVQSAIALAAETYGSQAVLNIFVVGILLFLIHWMYTMVLASLERDKKIDELTKKGT